VAADRNRTAGVLLALAVAVIAIATLIPGPPAVAPPPSITCVVCGVAGMADVIRNIVLFLPLGAALGLRGTGRWRSLLLGFVLSLFVESMQYAAIVGRDPTLSDVLTNTLGTLLGYTIGVTWPDWWRPALPLARRLTAAAAIGWLIVLTLTAVGLRPAFGTPPYLVNELPGPVAGVRLFEGVVLTAALDGQPLPPPRLAAASLRLRRATLPTDSLLVAAEVLAMQPPGLMRPFIALYLPDWTELLAFGQRRRRLVLRERTVGSAFQFVTPAVALAGAFPPASEIPTGDDPARGPRVRAWGSATATALSVTAERDGVLRTMVMPRSPLIGWTFLAAFGLAYDERGPWITFLWIAALLLPGAYWAGAASAAGNAGKRAWTVPASYALVTSAAMLIVPLAGHQALPTNGDWSVALATLVAGVWLGRRLYVTPSLGRRSSAESRLNN
jgi:hypothetical protein